MDLWEPRDAQRSVKAPGKKGHLNWAWKTVEGLASQWSEESEGGRYHIHKGTEEGQSVVIFERPC